MMQPEQANRAMQNDGDTRTVSGTVIIIDDDEDTLATLNTLVSMEGLSCETYSSALAYQAVLAQSDTRSTHHNPMQSRCIFCDVNMPGLTGIEFQEQIADQQVPLVLMSGDTNVKDVIRAFHLGIHDFLLKPIDMEAFLTQMHQMLHKHQQYLTAHASVQAYRNQLAQLTAREREVVDHLVAGKSNLQIAEILSISLRTIKFHRKNIYEKLNITSVAELVRIFQFFAH